MTQRLKGLVIILDGAGDRPAPGLGGATPLEAARTPVLDRLAGEGICGLVDPLYPGVPVGTQTGTGVLLGIAPGVVVRLHRGPVEAVGAGLHLDPGDVAIRCNFATLRPNGRSFAIEDRRAGRIREGTDELARALDGTVLDGIQATLRPASQHRAVLRLSGDGVSAAVTDTDPGAGHPEGMVLDSVAQDATDSHAVRTAAVVNAYLRRAHEVLRDHPVNRAREALGEPPANGIITRGAGRREVLTGIVRHMGLRAALVGGELSVLGLAAMLGFTVRGEPAFTGLPDTDLEGKAAVAGALLEDHDLVFLHLKGADICGHDLDAVGKMRFLERVDAALEPLPRDGLVIGVSSDHSTDSRTGRHSGDPVPSLLHSRHGRRDACTSFGETSCAVGGLGRISGTAFLTSVLDAMNVIDNFRPSDYGRLFGFA